MWKKSCRTQATGIEWLKNVEQLHDYMRVQGQEHHIPVMEQSDEDDADADMPVVLPADEQPAVPRRVRRRR